jgi:hypothetical protein
MQPANAPLSAWIGQHVENDGHFAFKILTTRTKLQQ